MERNTFAMKILEGRTFEFRQMTGRKWKELTDLLDEKTAENFSMWQIENIVFVYYETADDDKILGRRLKELLEDENGYFSWISDPTQKMRLMYSDLGTVRVSKELIRHRVFVTKLKKGCEEEYRRRHKALEDERGSKQNPGPDSNFTIWYADGYIMGYDEIDTSMERDETEEDREKSVEWETKMLEIMDWLTDDVDSITGLHHNHVVRIAYH